MSDNYLQNVIQLMLFIHHSLNLREFKFAQTLIFAIEEINNSTQLLPGIYLGYKIYDSCRSIAQTILSGMALMNGYEDTLSDISCSKPPTTHAIVGESTSSPTIGLASVVGPFNLPVVRTHFAACLCNQTMMNHWKMYQKYILEN